MVEVSTLGPDELGDLNRDVLASEIWTDRSGTNFRLASAPVELLLVFSRSGARSEDLAVDLDVILLVVDEGVFLPVLEEDRRLKYENNRSENLYWIITV